MYPSVSVIIPLYNHDKYIEDAIRSVQDQTISFLEIIVIDDGSKDNSGKIVSELAKNDDRIKYIYQENAGAHNAINKGIEMSKGDFVAILNSDDFFDEHRFERMIGAVKKTNADVVFSGIDFVDAEGKNMRNDWYAQSLNFYKINKNFPLALLNGNFIMTTSNLLIRRDVFDEIGLFNNLRYAHDLDFFLRLSLNNLKIEYVDEPLLFYRKHESNTINESHAKVRLEWAAIIAMFYVENFKKNDVITCDSMKDLEIFFEIINKHALMKYVFFYVKFYININDTKLFYDELMNRKDISEYILNLN